MRLFIAIDIDDDMREKFLPILNTLSRFSGIKTVEPQNLHITLKFLGEVDSIKAERVKEKLSEIDFKPFTISFSSIGFFPNEKYMRVVWVGAEGEELYRLAKNVEEKMRKLGFKKEKDFKGHLTLARIKRIERKEVLLKELERFNKRFGEMEVSEFKVKKSTLTSKGPIYEDLYVFGGR